MRGSNSLTNLLNDYGRRQVPTPAQELHWGGLVRRWLDHPDGPDQAPPGIRRAGHRARNRLVEGNVRWVVAIARKHCRGAYSEDRLMDAIQHGVLGLIRAVERFDPARGYKLSTFSHFWILQTIQRGEETRGIIRLPDAVLAECRKITRAADHLKARGIQPTRSRLAEETGIPGPRIAQRIEVDALKAVGSLDAPAQGGEGTSIAEMIPTPQDEAAEHGLELDLFKTWLDSQLDALSPRQREVMAMVRDGMGRRAIAAELGMTPSGVGSHHTNAVEKLRRLHNATALGEAA